MNLTFDLTEASDNTSVTIADTTPDWGAGEIQDVFTSGDATLNITIRGVVFDEINIKSYFNGGDQLGLQFVIIPEMLLINGTPQYDANDLIPDGDWYVVYYARHTVGGTTYDTVIESHYVYGVVEHGVLDNMRLTKLNDWSFDNTLHEALVVGAQYVYLEATKYSAYEGDVTPLREALGNLETMLENGNY